jgi:hypothetical protein
LIRERGIYRPGGTEMTVTHWRSDTQWIDGLDGDWFRSDTPIEGLRCDCGFAGGSAPLAGPVEEQGLLLNFNRILMF